MYKSTDGHEAILFDDILYFKANGAYTEIVLKKQLKIISRNIGELEEMLPSKFFFRTHHSFIVNANHIQRMELKRSGFIELNDGALIPVSQRKKKDFVDFMKALK
jgi:two-component system LytT family response regulator